MIDKIEFTKYLQNIDCTQSTIEDYQFKVEKFLSYIQKEDIAIEKKDVLSYLEHLKEKGLTNHSRSMSLNALRHYFDFLNEAELMVKEKNPCSHLKIVGTKSKNLYQILFTDEELIQMVDDYHHIFIKNQKEVSLSKQRNEAMLSVLLYQGATTREVDRILIDDLDTRKGTVKIRGSKRSNGRTINLEVGQVGLLIDYLQNIRPQLAERSAIESNKLFLPLPQYKNQLCKTDNLMNTFRDLNHQVKIIERGFINFKQARASIITNWIINQGLRKAQYLAGHKRISSTEEYIPNDVDSLADDINQFHPFQ